jgi:hypothetical protein
MHGLVIRDALVERIRVFHRTVLNAGRATRAFILDDIAGPFFQGHVEIALITFDPGDFGKCQNLYVWMPADLDQFR